MYQKGQKLDILICTIDAGITRVPKVLLEPLDTVRYVVSMQYTDERFLLNVPEVLKTRPDVELCYLEGRGLSRNRNHAFHKAQADILLIADDDEQLTKEGIENIITTYEQQPKLDIGLFQMTDEQGHFFKKYPSQQTSYKEAVKQGYYVASWEMTMRRSVVEKGLRFNEHFGLGSEFLSSGEEDVFLKDALDEGLQIACLPFVIGQTDPHTTGEQFLSSPKVQRSKGATFAYCYGTTNALYRCTKEALHYLVYHKANPFPLLLNQWEGIRFLQKLKTNQGFNKK